MVCPLPYITPGRRFLSKWSVYFEFPPDVGFCSVHVATNGFCTFFLDSCSHPLSGDVALFWEARDDANPRPPRYWFLTSSPPAAGTGWKPEAQPGLHAGSGDPHLASAPQVRPRSTFPSDASSQLHTCLRNPSKPPRRPTPVAICFYNQKKSMPIPISVSARSRGFEVCSFL